MLRDWSEDPLRFVLEAFPWRRPGSILSDKDGPYQWQREELSAIGAALREGREQGLRVIRRAVASGHGVGKSAFASWLVIWAAATFPEARGVVTANTDTQLRTKTWPEVTKWHSLLMPEVRAMFTVTATALISTQANCEKTWRMDAVPWSETNTEAFAGLHNARRRLLVLYDEASAISDSVWEVTEGALTDKDTEILWVALGNPTRNVGRFNDCWGRFRERWATRNIDSRTVPGTNLEQIAEWERDYGEDSDFFRVRVRGLAPSASEMGFVSTKETGEAMRRPPTSFRDDPLIMGIDVARGGADEFVISYRRGMDARTVPWIVIPGSETRDSMAVVTRIVDLATDSRPHLAPDAIVVDETGVGGPIKDRLRQMLGDRAAVYGVNFAAKSTDAQHANMRMTMYWRLREALRSGLALPADPVLERELTALEYKHDKSDRLLMVPKDVMKDELGFSPDRADSLALTFGVKIKPKTVAANRGGRRGYATM